MHHAQRNAFNKKKRTLAGPFQCFDAEAYLLLPPLRPGLPGRPPSSSFDRKGLPWFELPGSQASGPLPTPWLHLLREVPPPRVASQPLTVTSVKVTAAFASTLPLKGVVLPARPVTVMAAPARMVPWKRDVVMVAASATHQYTSHDCAPPAITTEKLVPVSAPVPPVPILKIHTALGLPWPSSVRTVSVNVT